MRNPLVFAAIGLALGLAAYWAAAPGGDTPGREAAVPAVAVPRAAPAAPVTVTRAPAEVRATETQVPSDEAFEEDPSLVPPHTAPEIAESPTPPLEPPQQRVDRLIAAGFSAERAAAIVQTESRVRLAAAQTEYQRTGTVRALSASVAGTVAGALREELGDADYERYLAATGQPTRVVVGDVEPGSAAANAGFLPGDDIRTYRGRRVFNVRELNASMLDGASGETVPATVVRDGQALQLYVDGGQLGIAARSAR